MRNLLNRPSFLVSAFVAMMVTACGNPNQMMNVGDDGNIITMNGKDAGTMNDLSTGTTTTPDLTTITVNNPDLCMKGTTPDMTTVVAQPDLTTSTGQPDPCSPNVQTGKGIQCVTDKWSVMCLSSFCHQQWLSGGQAYDWECPPDANGFLSTEISASAIPGVDGNDWTPIMQPVMHCTMQGTVLEMLHGWSNGGVHALACVAASCTHVEIEFYDANGNMTSSTFLDKR